MSDMTPEKALALLDGLDSLVAEIQSHPDLEGPYDKLEDARRALMQAAPDLARAYIAQAAELTRLRAQIEAADKLAEAMADVVGALDGAGEELSDFANILSREPWEAYLASQSVAEGRAALAEYQVKVAQLNKDFPNGI